MCVITGPRPHSNKVSANYSGDCPHNVTIGVGLFTSILHLIFVENVSAVLAQIPALSMSRKILLMPSSRGENFGTYWAIKILLRKI
jgi:hypothetical protein